MNHRLPVVLALGLSLLLGACHDSTSAGPSVTGGAGREAAWVGAWATAPYGPYPISPFSSFVPEESPVPLPPVPSLFLDNQSVDQSFRMVVHPTLGGEVVRLRLSNLMGDRPVTFASLSVAVSATETGPAIVPGSSVPVNFGGENRVTVAPGAEAVSDAVEFSYAVGEDLAISFFVEGESGPITWHSISFGPNYVSLPMLGDVTADPTGAAFTQVSLGWFFISGVDVLRDDSPGAVVAIGDSITDGAYTVRNTRWPDYFAQRLQDAGIAMGVLNQGINSNTVTRQSPDPAPTFQGPPAVERFERDVLQRSGVRSVVIFEGTNDLSGGTSAEAVFAGIRDMVGRAHAAGLCVVVGTIMTRIGTPVFVWDADAEAQRIALNAMIRAQTDVEGIADFDVATASPIDPTLPNPIYYAPDFLHPTQLGMAVMADAVPLEALVPPPAGNCTR